MSEEIKTFSSYMEWCAYIAAYMSKGYEFMNNDVITIQSSERVIAQWDKNSGYVSEGRYDPKERG